MPARVAEAGRAGGSCQRGAAPLPASRLPSQGGCAGPGGGGVAPGSLRAERAAGPGRFRGGPGEAERVIGGSESSRR